MRASTLFFLLILLIQFLSVSALPLKDTTAPASINRYSFFKDDKPIDITLVTDFRKMRNERKKGVYQNAKISMQIPGYELITEDVRMYARGEYRRKNCYMPSIMLNFKNQSSPQLSDLKKMKMVCGCGMTSNDEQLVLVEYLIYKMYNLLTDMSFQVRLAKVKYEDMNGKLRPYTQFAFLIEDVDEMAARSQCLEVENRMFLTEQTNRNQMTLVALFQYMIGNTDWSVPNYHNVKLIRPADDSTTLPYVVPYDFDYAGLVNAQYAIPAPELGIERVTDRLYRGFPRTLEELQSILQVFQKQKETIYSLVSNFELVRKKDRDIITGYLNEFYTIINNKRSIQQHFIDRARRN